jgi:diguanylate cyclase (GGDEF)-like protein
MNILIDYGGLRSCSIVIGDERYCLEKYFIKESDIEKAVSHKAIKEGEIVSVDDIRKKFGIEFSAKSIVSVPLKIKDKAIGAINMYDNKISSNDFDFISIIADQVAMAILNAQQYKEIKDITIIDKLTGVYNRRHFMELFETKLERFKEEGEAISLILLDIDDFGSYNNDFGHLKGDELLKGIGKILIDNVDGGIVGRYGGEEFIVLLEDKYTKVNDIAEKIRKKIEEDNSFQRKATVSLGLMTCLDKSMTKEEMIKEADSNLYRAKSAGKNQIVKTAVVRKNLKTDI